MEDNFKKTEYYLYRYKDLDKINHVIDIKIRKLMNEVKLGGGDYFGEKSSPTNAFSSSVESSVLYRDKNVYPEIEKLKTEKENNIIMKELITTVLELLEKEERKLIELRYFSKPKKSWDAISMEMCISKVACHSMRKEVVSKLSTYIV